MFKNKTYSPLLIIFIVIIFYLLNNQFNTKDNVDICINILKFSIFLLVCIIVINYSNKIINFVQDNFESSNETKCYLYDDYVNTPSLHNKHGANENELIKFSEYSECMRCKPGTFLDISQKKCTHCPVNHKSTSYNSLTCDKCENNTYNISKGNKTCLDLKELKYKDKSVVITNFEDLLKKYNEMDNVSNEKNIEQIISDDHDRTLDRYAEIHNTNQKIEKLKNSIDSIVSNLKDIKL